MHRHCHSRRVANCVVVVAAMLACGVAAACDTPVYRYAMYRWEPAEYLVYHFHAGKIAPQFAALQEKLHAAREQEISPANIAVRTVDVVQDPELQSVPREVRELRQKHTETPLTLVVSPLGIEVFHGDLGAQDADALLASPPRDAIGELLAEGNAGVFVLLLGSDAELNKSAQATTAKLVTDVNEGKISLYRAPDPFNPLAIGDSDPTEETESDQPPHTIAALTYTREQLQSQDPWLLRCLMAVEGDLHELQSEPMLFVVYGRGRALPPFVGKGITSDNLLDTTNFITGACSCTVKEQNPGVDLLMSFDWDAASAAVAKKFGAEEGSGSLGDLFPQLIPQTAVSQPAASAGSSSTAVESNKPTLTPLSPPASDNPDLHAAADAPTDDDENASAVDPDIVERNKTLANIDTRYAPRETPAEQASLPAASPQLLVPLGLCLAIGFVALLAVTFFVLKPQ